MNSLVIKILKPSASFRGVEYNGRKVEKGQAVLLHRSGFGVIDLQGRNPSWQELRQHLVSHSSGNPRVKLPQFHAILSCKDHSHTPEQLRKVGVDLMDRLGYGGNPMLFYTHHDTRNNHIHIVSSRVGTDGRKIPDRYEAIRSQRILLDLLGRDAGEQFRKAADKALSYRFSSMPQFMLLMEGQGYKGSRKGESLEFFKYGTVQGSLAVSIVASRIAGHRVIHSETGRIRAMIWRESHGLDNTLQDHGRKGEGGPPVWQSELTQHLQRKYGLEFVFFTGKGHQRPYGYAVIDNVKKAVYKGSEIVTLGRMIGVQSVGYRPFVSSAAEREEGGSRDIPIDRSAPLLSDMADDLLKKIIKDSETDVRREEGQSRKRRSRKPGRGG
jgi:hypothetical protein